MIGESTLRGARALSCCHGVVEAHGFSPTLQRHLPKVLTRHMRNRAVNVIRQFQTARVHHLVCKFEMAMQAPDVAQLGAACKALRATCCGDEVRWRTYYERVFKRQMPRGPLDERLTAFQLYSRKMRRAAYKNEPHMLELCLCPPAALAPVSATAQSSDAPAGMVGGPTSTLPAGGASPSSPSGRHRSRSRGESIDALRPEEVAAAAAPLTGIGAMRYVHVTRQRVAIAATDQGHLAAWAFQPRARPAAGGLAGPPQAPSMQADAFAHAVGAKARRDAKLKYAKTHESRLVYFKIQSTAAKRMEGFDIWGGEDGVMEGSEYGPGSCSAPPSRGDEPSSATSSSSTRAGWRETSAGITSGAADRSGRATVVDDIAHLPPGAPRSPGLPAVVAADLGSVDSLRSTVSSRTASYGAPHGEHAAAVSSSGFGRAAESRADAESVPSGRLTDTDTGSCSDTSGSARNGRDEGDWPFDDWDSLERDRAGSTTGIGGRRARVSHSRVRKGDGDSRTDGSGDQTTAAAPAGSGVDGAEYAAAGAGSGPRARRPSGDKPKGREKWSAENVAKHEARMAKRAAKEAERKRERDVKARGGGSAAPGSPVLQHAGSSGEVGCEGPPRSRSASGGRGSPRAAAYAALTPPLLPAPGGMEAVPPADLLAEALISAARGASLDDAIDLTFDVSGMLPGDGDRPRDQSSVAVVAACTAAGGAAATEDEEQSSEAPCVSSDDNADEPLLPTCVGDVGDDVEAGKPTSLVRRGTKAERRVADREKRASREAAKLAKRQVKYGRGVGSPAAPDTSGVTVTSLSLSATFDADRSAPSARASTHRSGATGASTTSPIVEAQRQLPATPSLTTSSAAAVVPVGAGSGAKAPGTRGAASPRAPAAPDSPAGRLAGGRGAPPARTSAEDRTTQAAATAVASQSKSSSPPGVPPRNIGANGSPTLTSAMRRGTSPPISSPVLAALAGPASRLSQAPSGAAGGGLSPPTRRSNAASPEAMPALSLGGAATDPPQARSGSSSPAHPGAGAGAGAVVAPGLRALSSNRPRGSKLRADIWFAHQWVRSEPPVVQQWREAALRAEAQTFYFGSGLPHSVGSGHALSYHAVVAFQDGSIGVLTPLSVSPRRGDVVVLSGTGAPVAGAAAVALAAEAARSRQQHPAPQQPQKSPMLHKEPVVIDAAYLAPAPRMARAVGGGGGASGVAAYTGPTPPSWPQCRMTWLDRPLGEDKDRAAAAAVVRGRPFIRTVPAAPSTPATGTDVVVLSDVEPDIVCVAFGRVVGVWHFHGASAGPHGRESSAAAAGVTEGSLASPVKSSQGDGPSSADARRGARKRDVDTPAADGIPVSSGGVALPAVSQGLRPAVVFRGHMNVVTCVACCRRSPVDAAEKPAIPFEEVTAVSGDAGGDIVLWDAATATKLHAFSLARTRGTREGVACVVMDDNLIVAGGSEGTVAIWRRRTAGGGHGCGPELVPELLVREPRAHTIVRAIFTPRLPACGVAGVLTGGGEGDVRLWPLPKLGSGPASLQPASGSEPGAGLRGAPPLVAALSVAGGSPPLHPLPMPQAASAAGTRLGIALPPHAPAAGANGEGASRALPPAHSAPATSCVDAPAPLLLPAALTATSPILPALLPTAAATAATASAATCKVMRGHSARITALYMDNFKILSASLDGCIKVWDLQEPHVGRCLQTVRLPSEASSMSCAGDIVSVGTVDGRVIVLAFGESAAALTGGSSGSSAAALPAGGGPATPGTASLLESCLTGVIGGAGGSRKGGAEQAYGMGRGGSGQSGGAGKSRANTQRRGLRDLRALVKGAEGTVSDDLEWYAAAELQESWDDK